MSVARTRFRAVAVAAAGLVAAVGLSACEPGPASLQVRTVASGLDHPWDLAFLPDGSIVITERPGRIRLRTPSGQLRTIADPSDVVAQGEGGMLGLAVDPDFAENRRIYTCFVSDAGSGIDVRLVRWRLTAAGDRLHLRSDIVTGMPVNQDGQLGRHSGCRPRFGPDGRLWIGTGDAATSSVPQSKTSLGGKVLRVDTNGNGVAGNAGAVFDARIYSYGHRNVQGIAFSPGGRAYSVEHGPGRDDEVNRLVAGANYGWDPRPAGGGSSYDESRPMTDLGRHPSARSAVWSSGDPTIAPSGATFLSASKWKGWRGTLAVAVLKGQQLRFLRLDGTGDELASQWVRVTNQGRLRVVVQGPDGDLFLLQDSSNGSILRITPQY